MNNSLKIINCYLSPMAHVQVNKLTSQEVAELACTYAALLLHDDQQDITGDKISKLVSTAGIKIEPYWPKLFAKALQGQDIASFFSFGGSSSAPAQSEPAKAAPVADKKAEEKGGKKEQKKKEAPPPPPEEEDVDMGDLFG